MIFRIILPTSRHKPTDHSIYYFFSLMPIYLVRLLEILGGYHPRTIENHRALFLYAGLDSSLKDIAAMITVTSSMLNTMD